MAENGASPEEFLRKRITGQEQRGQRRSRKTFQPADICARRPQPDSNSRQTHQRPPEVEPDRGPAPQDAKRGRARDHAQVALFGRGADREEAGRDGEEREEGLDDGGGGGREWRARGREGQEQVQDEEGCGWGSGRQLRMLRLSSVLRQSA